MNTKTDDVKAAECVEAFRPLVAMFDGHGGISVETADDRQQVAFVRPANGRWANLFAASPKMYEALRKAKTCRSIPDYVMELIDEALSEANPMRQTNGASK